MIVDESSISAVAQRSGMQSCAPTSMLLTLNGYADPKARGKSPDRVRDMSLIAPPPVRSPGGAHLRGTPPFEGL